MREQKMADLPKLHVEPAPPFTYCGIDFFGSWHVQYGRSVVKRNGALFTCMASRAVNIEVADSLQPILSSTEKIHLSKKEDLSKKSTATEEQISLAQKPNLTGL